MEGLIGNPSTGSTGSTVSSRNSVGSRPICALKRVAAFLCFLSLGINALQVFDEPSDPRKIQEGDVEGIQRNEEIEQRLETDFGEMFEFMGPRWPQIASAQREILGDLLVFYKKGYEPQFRDDRGTAVISRPVPPHPDCKGLNIASAYHELAHAVFNDLFRFTSGEFFQAFIKDVKKLAQNVPSNGSPSRADNELKSLLGKSIGCGPEIDFRTIPMLFQRVMDTISSKKYSQSHLDSARLKGLLSGVKSPDHLKDFEVLPTLVEFFTPAIFSEEGEELLKKYFPKTYNKFLKLMEKLEKALEDKLQSDEL